MRVQLMNMHPYTYMYMYMCIGHNSYLNAFDSCSYTMLAEMSAAVCCGAARHTEGQGGHHLQQHPRDRKLSPPALLAPAQGEGHGHDGGGQYLRGVCECSALTYTCIQHTMYSYMYVRTLCNEYSYMYVCTLCNEYNYSIQVFFLYYITCWIA